MVHKPQGPISQYSICRFNVCYTMTRGLINTKMTHSIVGNKRPGSFILATGKPEKILQKWREINKRPRK